MALVGNMIAEAVGGNPSIVNYTMFVAVFGMLSLFYLIGAAIIEALAIPIASLALDALNTIFFLIGGIALAADLGVHSCGNKGYISTNGTIDGSHNQGKRCHEAQAVTAFLWFGFAAWVASLVLTALDAKSSGTSRTGGIRRGGPAMSQV